MAKIKGVRKQTKKLTHKKTRRNLAKHRKTSASRRVKSNKSCYVYKYVKKPCKTLKHILH